MSAKLDGVDKAIHVVHHASLSRMHVSQKTKKEFRMLPEMYQGLGVISLYIDSLGAIIYFLR